MKKADASINVDIPSSAHGPGVICGPRWRRKCRGASRLSAVACFPSRHELTPLIELPRSADGV